MVVTFLRHGSNAVIVAGAIAIVLGAAFGAFALAPLAVAIGVVLFFLTEYGTHRYVLHAPPAKAPFVLKLQHRLHYDHHVEPSRLDLLFLPWWALAPILVAFGLAYFLITRSGGIALGLVLGNLLGLLYYEWVHYVAHIPYQPRTPFGRWMKKYHLWHHFKNERLWYGVTNPTMDLVARTYARVDEVEKSGTTRVLFR
jgi:4-hydroxysphinganine ceramide fatty acyl 2-hydroxylase